MRKIITAPTDIEDNLYAQGLSPVAGVDEVGRGPLAGPVVACAIILPKIEIAGINDSKKISAKRREELAAQLKEVAVSYAFGIIQPEEIDRINILQATLKAMAEAVAGLEIAPKIALVDGISAPDCICPVRCVKNGDSASRIIAAASILAKVMRDNMMQDLHRRYPEYAWDTNKGYGTAAHIEAIRRHGLTPAHRRSFCKSHETNRL
ncbi:MAG: ribonuclease HII [Defluviitaleaceae bacterium]|nr:ribonuclease HII [Defluviitaleaceae bacterium]